MTDAELLAAIADGRTDALRELHERHAPWLAMRLSHRGADRYLVDEVAILGWDSTSTRWKACSYFLAASLVAVGITGPWTRTPYPEAATTIATIAVVLWGITAIRRVGPRMTTSDG